jgi:hypothetical protein
LTPGENRQNPFFRRARENPPRRSRRPAIFFPAAGRPGAIPPARMGEIGTAPAGPLAGARIFVKNDKERLNE